MTKTADSDWLGRIIEINKFKADTKIQLALIKEGIKDGVEAVDILKIIGDKIKGDIALKGSYGAILDDLEVIVVEGRAFLCEECFNIVYQISKHKPKVAIDSLKKISINIGRKVESKHVIAFKALSKTAIKIMEDRPENYDADLEKGMLKKSDDRPDSFAMDYMVEGSDAEWAMNSVDRSIKNLRGAFHEASKRKLNGETGPTRITKLKRLCGI